MGGAPRIQKTAGTRSQSCGPRSECAPRPTNVRIAAHWEASRELMSIFRFARLAPLIVASGMAVLLPSPGEDHKAGAPPPPPPEGPHPPRPPASAMDE